MTKEPLHVTNKNLSGRSILFALAIFVVVSNLFYRVLIWLVDVVRRLSNETSTNKNRLLSALVKW